MDKPMRATPILFGKDARRFEHRMKHVRKETPEERERRLRNYEACVAMIKAGEEYDRQKRAERDGEICAE